MDATPAHHYTSTACIHGNHDYCAAPRRPDDGTPKRPGVCKFCDAKCLCECHSKTGAEASEPSFAWRGSA